MNYQPISPNQSFLQDIVSGELAKQDTIPDVKYQDIIYYMHDTSKTVKSDERIHIDFLKAMSEMEKIDWKYVRNYIGFVNQKTEECIQFIRVEKDKWYSEVLIDHRKGWNGYVWYDHTDSKTIGNVLRLFFEEVPWFGMLSWKLKRIKEYAKD